MKTQYRKYLNVLTLLLFIVGFQIQFETFLDERIFLIWYPTIFLVALLCGFGPGLLATFVSTLFIWFFLLDPGVAGAPQLESNFLAISVFSITGVASSVYSSQIRKLKTNLLGTKDEMRTIFQFNPTPILVVNPNLTIRSANKAFFKNFQMAASQVIGRPVKELTNDPKECEVLLELLRTILEESAQVSGVEFEFMSPIVGKRTLVLNGVRARLHEFSKELAIIGIEDITEKKKIQNELKVSEQKYRGLVASAYDGIMVVAQDGSIEYSNGQLEKMFGYQSGELLYQKYHLLMPKIHRLSGEAAKQDPLMDPLEREMGRASDLNGIRKDGSEFPIDISFSSFRSEAKIFINCLVRDVTEQKRIESIRRQLVAQQRILLAEAASASRAKDDFLSVLSHELRTPLTTILGWTQELLAKETIETDVREGLLVLERSAQVQGQLINDLLDVSRIQSGKMILEFQKIDLEEVLMNSMAAAKIAANRKSIQIVSNIEKAPVLILADPMRLEQVIWNLLSNAIKFTPENGKVTVSLSILEAGEKQYAKVQISDTGIGIPSNFLDKVFDRFHQADSAITRVYGGLGLGLSIVKSLAEMHQGSIKVESEGIGMGATLTLQLPLLLDENSNLSISNIDRGKKERTTFRLDGIRVLVVDDNIDNLNLFSISLRKFGALVRTEESAIKGLAAILEFKPDILLSDISMPGEDGYVFIRKVRELGINNYGGIPAVALTAYAAAEEIKKAIDAGFDAHIAKPVDKNVLSGTIVEMLK